MVGSVIQTPLFYTSVVSVDHIQEVSNAPLFYRSVLSVDHGRSSFQKMEQDVIDRRTKGMNLI